MKSSKGGRAGIESTASFSGASFLILSQVVSKLGTFSLNQLLLRHISPNVLGVTSYLEFLVSTILFFSREGQRLAIQRTKTQIKNENGTEETDVTAYQSIVNFAFIPLIIGLPTAGLICVLQGQSALVASDFAGNAESIAYFFIFLSICSELVSEPAYSIVQYRLNLKTRSKFESIATIVRCLTIFLGTTILHNSWGDKQLSFYEGFCILIFSLGQLSYSISLAVLYLNDFNKRNLRMGLKNRINYRITKLKGIYKEKNQSFYLDGDVFRFWKTSIVQLLFKQFLTEVDQLILIYFCSVESQGVYALVSNYGSMIARILFLPIEETLRLFLTKRLRSMDPRNIRESRDMLQNILYLYLNFSVLIILGGWFNSPLFLNVVLGGKRSKWKNTNVFEIIQDYIIYIPFLAFNGILEAFFSSVADSKDIRHYSAFMSCSSFLVSFLSYILVKKFDMDLKGIILTNIFNMALRILYCIIFIKRFYRVHKEVSPFGSLARNAGVPLLASALVAAFQLKNMNVPSSSLSDFLKSCILCLFYLVVIIAYENRNIKKIYNILRHRSSIARSEY